MKNKKIIVRERFQVTIPDELRELVSWLQVGGAVNITVKENKIILSENSESENDSDQNWEKFFDGFDQVREIAKKYKTEQDSTDIIRKDRDSNHGHSY